MIATLLVSLTVLTAAPPCTGTLSGAVTASFACTTSVSRSHDGAEVLTISTTGPVEGVPSVVPGSFELPGRLRPGTYTLDQLGKGMASVGAEDRTLYVASKTFSQRGEVTLIVKSVEPPAGGKGSPVLHGSYRARLIPAGGGKSGEVLVAVEF